MDFQSAYERMLEVTGEKTQHGLAGVLGIKQASIADAKRRNVVPPAWLIKLYHLYGLNPDWVTDGIEPKSLRRHYAVQRGEVAARGSKPEIVYAAVYDISKGAGGEDGLPVEAVKRIPLHGDLFFAELIVLKADNDNMLPMFGKGALVGVNQGYRKLRSGETYCFNVPDEGLVFFRVYHDLERSRVRLCSLADGGPEMELDAGDFEGRVVGRVVWTLNHH